LKSQVVVDPATRQIIATAFSCGRCHDFRLFKESSTQIHPHTQVVTDTGYQGIGKIHPNSRHPKKHSRRTPLSRLDRQDNRALSRARLLNEHVIGALKRFKIIAERYRNRRKRFRLRFNLIAGIYNFQLKS